MPAGYGNLPVGVATDGKFLRKRINETFEKRSILFKVKKDVPIAAGLTTGILGPKPVAKTGYYSTIHMT